MGHVTINTIVESKFSTDWGATTPIRFENIPFTPPVTSWVAISVKEGDSQKISLGPGLQCRRTLGIIFVEIFTALDIGSATARGYADTIKGIFRDYRSGGIHVYEGDVFVKGQAYYTNSGSGEPATSQWWQMIVSFPFKFDESL